MKKLPITRVIVALTVIGISVLAAVSRYASVIAAGGNDHQTADWLISYPGYFVRRGLFGELLFAVTPPGTATLWALFTVQVMVFLAVVAFFIEYLFRARFSWSAIALACSPAAVAFAGWDPLGGFRKEILGFLALILLALARRQMHQVTRIAVIVASVLTWTLAVFSWEAMAFLLPAVGFLLLIDTVVPLRRVLAGIYTAIGLGAFGASVLVHGGTETPAQLCTAVVERGLGTNLCTGAIAWMGRDLNASLELVNKNLAVHSGYLVMLALAVLPLALSPWLRRYWPWALAALIGIAPLFVLGIDYGRWIHILVIELAICVMASHTDLIESPLWNPLSVGLYVSLWGIPHAAPTAANLPGWPLKGLMSTLITWAQTALLGLR